MYPRRCNLLSHIVYFASCGLPWFFPPLWVFHVNIRVLFHCCFVFLFFVHKSSVSVVADPRKRIESYQIMLAWNVVFQVKYHFIRDVLDRKHIELVKVHGNDDIVDVLTKDLLAGRFPHCRKIMGIG